MPGRMARRKSAKSLVNLTGTLLDLTEEEKRIYQLGSVPHTQVRSTSNAGTAADKDERKGASQEQSARYEADSDFKAPTSHSSEAKVIEDLKKKMDSFNLTDDANERADEEELLNENK